MLSRVVSTVPFSLTKTMMKSSSQVQPKQRQRIPKVTDKIVWLTVTDTEGDITVIPGMEGETILHALERNKIFIPASCRGGDLIVPENEEPSDNLRYGPSCSECQVVVFEPWANQIKPMSDLEHEQIIRSPTGFFTSRSRLSCCINLHKWMNGMELTIPLIPASTVNGPDPIHSGENRIHER